MGYLKTARFRPSVAWGAALLWSGVASAAPTINSVTPTAGAMIQAAVTVTVKTTAVTYPVSKVTADVGGQLITLTYNAGSNSWSGQLAPLTNVPFGPIDLTVTAYDTAPSQSTSVVPLIHDEKPQVKLVSGRTGVYQPTSMPIRVTCVDDDPSGCASTTLSLDTPNNGTVVLATGTSVVDTVLDLSPYDGQDVRLWWRGYDSRSQQGFYFSDFRIISTPPPICQLWGPPNPNNSGPDVLDVDSDRVLLQDGVVVDRRTKQQTIIPKPAGFTSTVMYGALFPGGAAVSYSQDQTSYVQLWHSGGGAGGTDARAVNARFTLLGNYLCGSTNVLSAADGLYAGCASTTSFMSGTGAACASAIVADPDIQVHNAACDNGNVAYVFSTKSIPGTDHRGLRFRDRNGNVADLVTERVGYDAQARFAATLGAIGKRNTYDVAGDWMFFSAVDAQGIRQHYRRDPNGTIAALAANASNNDNFSVHGIAPSGEVFGEAPLGGGTHWGLHRVGVGAILSTSTFIAPKSSAQGWSVVWRDGAWRMFDDRAAYALNDGAAKPFDCPQPTTPLNDAGAGADGASDAAVNPDAGSTSSSSSGASTSSSSSSSSSGASSGASSGTASGGVLSGAAGADAGASGAGESAGCSLAASSSRSTFALVLSAVALVLGLKRRNRN